MTHDEEDALDSQQTLVETSLPLVFETYDEAVDGGISQPIVIVVDCEDELGGQIARGWLGDEVIDDAVAACASDEDADQEPTTVFARAIGWQEGRTELSEAFPYLAPSMASGPPDDGVFVIGITAGGASALTAPWDARS